MVRSRSGFFSGSMYPGPGQLHLEPQPCRTDKLSAARSKKGEITSLSSLIKRELGQFRHFYVAAQNTRPVQGRFKKPGCPLPKNSFFPPPNFFWPPLLLFKEINNIWKLSTFVAFLPYCFQFLSLFATFPFWFSSSGGNGKQRKFGGRKPPLPLNTPLNP